MIRLGLVTGLGTDSAVLSFLEIFVDCKNGLGLLLVDLGLRVDVGVASVVVVVDEEDASSKMTEELGNIEDIVFDTGLIVVTFSSVPLICISWPKTIIADNKARPARTNNLVENCILPDFKKSNCSNMKN